MSERLIYIIGPSGAGKDSLLAWLRQHLPIDAPLHWARRSITRAADGGNEDHESVDQAGFSALRSAGHFALHWEANGLSYGVRQTELEPLAQRHWVLLNGSRSYLPEVRRRYQGVQVVHITANAATLEKRLLSRGRETAAEVQARVQRALAFSPVTLGAPDASVIEIQNNASLVEAGQALLQALQQLEGWPATTP